MIIIGPGSTYTSDATRPAGGRCSKLTATSRRCAFFVCNVMTQPGETGTFTAS